MSWEPEGMMCCSLSLTNRIQMSRCNWEKIFSPVWKLVARKFSLYLETCSLKHLAVFLPSGPMLMITEYCSHGDLLNFLRTHAQDIMASILSVDEVEGEAFYKNMAALHARLRRSDTNLKPNSLRCSEKLYHKNQWLMRTSWKQNSLQKCPFVTTELNMGRVTMLANIS